jgi:hypothetical protein
MSGEGARCWVVALVQADCVIAFDPGLGWGDSTKMGCFQTSLRYNWLPCATSMQTRFIASY